MIVLGVLGATTLHYNGREVALRPTRAILSLIFASEPGNAVPSHEIQRAICYAHDRGIDDAHHKRLQHDLLNGNLPMTGPPRPDMGSAAGLRAR